MKVFSSETTISATAETIWTILTDGLRYPEWDPNAIRIEGQIVPYSKIVVYTKVAPGRAFPVTVKEFVPGKKMIWASGMPFGLFKGERTFMLTPQANGQILFSLREQFSGPLLALIGPSLPDMTVPFQQFTNGLKSRAEGIA